MLYKCCFANLPGTEKDNGFFLSKLGFYFLLNASDIQKSRFIPQKY